MPPKPTFNKGKKSDVPEAPDAKGGSSIKTVEDFQKIYPDITIDYPQQKAGVPKFKMKLAESYNTREFRDKVIEWLRSIAPRLAVSMNVIKRDNESSLYPMFWDLLKELSLLSNEQTDIQVHLSNQPTMDEIERAVSEVAIAVKTRQSISTSASEGKPAADPEYDDDEDYIPDVADTSSAEDLQCVYVAIEKQLQKLVGGGGSAGRVEFALYLGQYIRFIMEAKLALASDKQQGFYQACSYMANVYYSTYKKKKSFPDVVYGAYTDHTFWVFLELKDNKITCTRKLQLTDGEGTSFVPESIEVFSFLFQCANINPNFTVIESIAAVDAQIADYAQELMKHI